MTWNTQRISTLKSLWSQGRTASAIAAILGGVTRNAVIGKVHRLMLPGRASARPAPRSRKSRSPARVSSAPCTTAHRSTAAPSPFALPNLAPAPPVHPGVQELNPTQCRWPEGDPKTPAFHFCGRERLPQKSYCPHHFALSISAQARRTSPALHKASTEEDSSANVRNF